MSRGHEAGMMQINKTCATKAYQVMLERIDTWLKLGSFYLVKDIKYSEDYLLSSAADPDDPPASWKKSRLLLLLWRAAKSLPGLVFTHFIISYITLKMIFSSLILYDYQKLLNRIGGVKAKLKPSIGITIASNTSTSLYINHSAIDRARSLSNYIEFLGVPTTTNPGVGFLMMGCLGIGSLAYYQWSTICFRRHWPKVRSNHLGFLFEPRHERRRVCNILDEIIRNLSHTCLSASILHPEISASKRKFGSNTNLTIHPRTLDVSLKPEDRTEKFAFLDRARRIAKNRNKLDGSDIEWPYMISAEWHRKFTYINLATLKITRALATWIFVLLLSSLIFLELFGMAKERYSRYIKNNHQYEFHLDPFRLQSLRSEVETRLYLSSSGSLSELIIAAITVESKYYFTLNRIIFLIELYSWGLFVASLAGLVGAFIMASVFYQIGWLKQLKEQLACLVKLAQRHRMDGYSSSSAGLNRPCFVDQLIKVYLNYELFRRQNPSYQMVLNLLLPQVALFSTVSLICTYLIAIDLDLSNKEIVLFASTCVMVSANCCMLVSAYKSKMALDIMRYLYYLVAQCSVDGLAHEQTKSQFVIPVDLWRRQLLDEDDLKRFYAAKLFGYYVTFENVMSMNAYFLAIWLIMLRISNT